MPLIDIHTHLKKPPPDGVIALNSLMAGEKSAQGNGVFNSLGIHPWQLIRQDEQQLKKLFFDNLETENWAAIGEAGLDRTISVPFDKQMAIFRFQSELAAEKGLPLIIHAVRSYHDLINLRKQMPKQSQWIVHGFNGNVQTAKQLFRHDICLSFGPSLLKKDHKCIEAFEQTPLQQLFLETDDSGMAINVIYNAAAAIRNVHVDELEHGIRENFNRLFRL
jgi:TatD DNase family protein